MKKPLTLAAIAALAGLTAPGCLSTAIKEGAGVALGAKGTYLIIQPLSPDKEARPLGEYTRFELGPITDGIGGRTPSDFLSYLPKAFEDEMKDTGLPDDPSGKTLVIRGTITHYETSGMLGLAMGPMEEVIVRTELVDKASGQVLGVANCIGRTTEGVNMGVRKKAQGLAKAFAKWIEDRYPKDMLKRR